MIALIVMPATTLLHYIYFNAQSYPHNAGAEASVHQKE